MENNVPKTREEKWQEHYRAVWEFVESNHRGPSRHHIEEHRLLNWMKSNRKARNNGTMPAHRIEPFKKLTDFINSFNRINQYL